jgi:hypothetical protein
MATALKERACTQSVVLDIGQDIGALIVYAGSALNGREIEISPKTNAAMRTHAVVWERLVAGRREWAAVFPSLTDGVHSLWRDVLTDQDVTIVGGRVTEVDWRDVTDADDFREARPERGSASISRIAPPPAAWRGILPPRYRQSNVVSATPMSAAPLRYSDSGEVAWDQMWGGYCDLALAGGPRHRDTLLEPATPEEAAAAPDAYARVVAELERGLRMVTALPIARSRRPGWVGVQCGDDAMARWLLRAIAEENVSVSRQGAVLYLPAAPTFRLDKEIKNVVTAVAKTHHYWREHRDAWG